MTKDIEKALNKLKKAKLKYKHAKELFLNSLPDSVQSTFHYDGLEGVRHRHPDYYNYLKELKE